MLRNTQIARKFLRDAQLIRRHYPLYTNKHGKSRTVKGYFDYNAPIENLIAVANQLRAIYPDARIKIDDFGDVIPWNNLPDNVVPNTRCAYHSIIISFPR